MANDINRFGRRNAGNFGSMASGSIGASRLNSQMSRGQFLRRAGAVAGGVAAAGLGFGGVANSYDTTLYVPSPAYPTIQAAILGANPDGGSTIIVAGGQYAGAYIDRPVTIIGSTDPSNPSIINVGYKAFLGDRFGFYINASFENPGPEYKQVVGVTISNFTIQCVTTPGGLRNGIGGRGANNVTISNNIIIAPQTGILNIGGQNWTISNNTIEGLTLQNVTSGGANAISFNGSIVAPNTETSNNRVVSNTINATMQTAGSGARGIYFFLNATKTLAAPIVNNVISDNVFYIRGPSQTPINSQGMYIGAVTSVPFLTGNPEYFSDNIIARNTFNTGAYGIYVGAGGARNQFIENIFVGDCSQYIRLTGVYGCNIERNRIDPAPDTDARPQGIVALVLMSWVGFDGVDIDSYNNTITANDFSALIAYNQISLDIWTYPPTGPVKEFILPHHNVFKNNDYGPAKSDSGDVYYGGAWILGTDNTFVNENFWGSPPDIYTGIYADPRVPCIVLDQYSYKLSNGTIITAKSARNNIIALKEGASLQGFDLCNQVYDATGLNTPYISGYNRCAAPGQDVALHFAQLSAMKPRTSGNEEFE